MKIKQFAFTPLDVEIDSANNYWVLNIFEIGINERARSLFSIIRTYTGYNIELLFFRL